MMISNHNILVQGRYHFSHPSSCIVGSRLNIQLCLWSLLFLFESKISSNLNLFLSLSLQSLIMNFIVIGGEQTKLDKNNAKRFEEFREQLRLHSFVAIFLLPSLMIFF